MPEPLPEYKRLALEQRRSDLLDDHKAASKQWSEALGAVEQERIKRQIAHLEEQIQEIDRQLGTSPAPVAADEVHYTSTTASKPPLEPAKEPQTGAKPVTPSTPDVAPPKSGLGGWFSRLPDAGKAAVITGVFAVIVALIPVVAGLARQPVAATPTPTDTATPVLSATPTVTEPPIATPAPTVTDLLGETLTIPTILNLRDGDLTSYTTSLLGVYPAGLSETIRVFVVPPPQLYDTTSNLYPQLYNRCRGNDGAAMQDGQWEQHIEVGWGLPITEDVGLSFDVVVTTATDAGNAAVVAEIQRWCDDPEEKWLGFPRLPAGVDEIERITVTRSGELVRAPNLSGAQLAGDLRITSPRDGQMVMNAQVISGIYRNLPANHTVWILVYTISGKWLPQSSDACAGVHTIAENGRWQVASNAQTNSRGEPFEVVAVVADPEANAFFDQKQRQWCAQAAASPDFRWPGLLTIDLPAGITEKDRIQLFHR